MDEIKGRETHRVAKILAIGTANPPNCFHQSDYPDYYFRVTNSNHLTDLKSKFQRICEKSMIKKRYMHVNEKLLKENPSICAPMLPSLDARLEIEISEVAKLGAEAATKAIEEWGQPKSRITHLVFASCFGAVMPGADYQITKLLGLNPNVKRYISYLLGCYAGGTVIRIAKDLAENNVGARVLVICSEVMVNAFRGPVDTHPDILVGHAIFGDGAGAVIVGADPDLSIERPIFEILSTGQTILPDSEGKIGGQYYEVGLLYYIAKEVCDIIAKNIEHCLEEAFEGTGVTDWNSLFWVVHTGGRAILDNIESKLDLKNDKLKATRNVMSDFGNMSSASVIFVLDEMRRLSLAEGRSTSGEGYEYGVLLGFGPGVTVETIVLRSVPTSSTINE